MRRVQVIVIFGKYSNCIKNRILSHGVNTWKYTKRRYFGRFSDISVIRKCHISVTFLSNKNKEMSIFSRWKQGKYFFTKDRNMWKFLKRQSFLIMKIYMVFSYTENVITRYKIIIFSRASWLRKIKNSISPHKILEGNMLFQEFQ